MNTFESITTEHDENNLRFTIKATLQNVKIKINTSKVCRKFNIVIILSNIFEFSFQFIVEMKIQIFK